MICSLMICGLLIGQPLPPRTEPAKRLDELAGRWLVAGAGSSSAEKCPDELLGLTEKGAEVVVKDNEMTIGGKRFATLTTDFSGTGLDFDKMVWIERMPVLLTTPAGRGVLCAYQVSPTHLEFVYPHSQTRISAGTRIYLKRPDK